MFYIYLSLILATPFAIAALLVLCLRYIFRKLAPYYIYHPGTADLIPVRCPTCRGRRVMWMYNDNLIRIPHYRDRRNHEDRQFRPPVQNVIRCPTCQGLGAIWTKRPPKPVT